ncbi:MAG: hypothetical protein JWQ76_713 [Ramlibacter sp.]|nr:hypothetical protein [Ramlibacter sp.]
MTHSPRMPLAAFAFACSLLGACGGGGGTIEVPPVSMAVVGPNAISRWYEVASTTALLPASATGTPEEQRPNATVDLATVQLAVYDALMAIVGTHKPYAITPATPGADASQEAAIAAATYGVLKGLFPSRSASYQGEYDSYLATSVAGPARTAGLAIGSEAAAGMLALRANDGRSVALAPYVPGTAPGQFRGTNPIGRFNAYIKPFTLTSNAQFRAPGPPALDSAAYAADVNETMRLGSLTSTTRSAEQTELARFATENPGTFWARTLRTFIMTEGSLAEHARLLAMLSTAQADAGNACFDSKYFYQAWRPASAITLAAGNPAITADPDWKPVVATPNHPEYPAAHSCVSTATAETLRGYFGTSRISFDVSSTVTATTRHYTSTDAMIEDFGLARIYGGMHFRTSTVDGTALGRNVAAWMLARHFQPR